jgi:predicted membrane channel-forming protein YqfA (hemolysin III family)
LWKPTGSKPVLARCDSLGKAGIFSGETAMLFEGGFTFANFVANLFSVFIFVLWLWLLITVFGDLFRRHDVSGPGKVVWVILLIVLPYIGIFAYLVTQGGGMATRSREQAEQAHDRLRQAVGFSVADEIAKLDRLKAAQSISGEEYARLRARLVQ